jgi:hypothetical protein
MFAGLLSLEFFIWIVFIKTMLPKSFMGWIPMACSPHFTKQDVHFLIKSQSLVTFFAKKSPSIHW